jgi:hypothetical protein
MKQFIHSLAAVLLTVLMMIVAMAPVFGCVLLFEIWANCYENGARQYCQVLDGGGWYVTDSYNK